MDDSRFSRTELLIGNEAVGKLKGAKVLLFGLGGVGGAAFEALCRAGIENIEAVDSDVFALSNINRQVLASESTVGMRKTDAAEKRCREINPNASYMGHCIFVSGENIGMFDFSRYDYVIDAIDTVSAKLMIIERCRDAGTPVISCMGTGNKLDPCMLRIGDIYDTYGCPLARVMRRELKRRGIDRLAVVWSPEEPKKPAGETDEKKGRGVPPGTVPFVPPVAGYMLASAVIRHIAGV